MTAGKVYLIGAGPGAADLVSLRGYRALRSADAVLIDRLLPRNVLGELGISTAEKDIEWLADKNPHWSQGKINAWLTAQARQEKIVARLKGGDPFVFGQAEEETGHLSKLGVPWEVIPGASSFTAALTAAGFPLTRRQQGRSFSVATAKLEGGRIAESFPKSDSLLIMMGVAALDQIVARLLADGWPADTQTAIVERGTLTWERRVSCPLGRLAATAKNAAVSSPACLIVGNAATPLFASRQRPTILFTGLDPSNFRTLGNLIHWPALEVVPDQQSRRLLRRTCTSILDSRFDWIVFVDKLGVMSFFEELDRQRLDTRALAGVKIATVGGMTADRLGEHGLRPDLLLETHAMESTRGLRRQCADKSFMIVEGTHLSQRLHKFLVGCNAQVNHFVLNQVIPNRQLGRILPEHDVVYFVSPCGVRAYFSEYGHAAFQKEAWCLGRDTECVLAGYGIKAKIVIADNRAESSVLVSA